MSLVQLRPEAPDAGVAHLVERHLAKVEVASSSLVTRSKKKDATKLRLFFCPADRGSNRASALSFFRRAPGCACRGRCRAQLFATKERYRCGLPLAGTHRPASAILHRAIVFECRGGRLCPPAKAPSASEEACCIPFPPGRRKLHIRSLLLPSQIVTVSLGHNLAIWNFTTPHAILMMAGRQHFTDTACRGRCPHRPESFPWGKVAAEHSEADG